MKPHDPAPSQGNRDVLRHVGRDPARGRRGSRDPRVSVDELIAQSRTVLDRVRPLIDRAAARIRARLRRVATRAR
jgi:hypothetical protein